MIRYVALGALVGFLFAYLLLSREAPAPAVAAVPGAEAPRAIVSPKGGDQLLKTHPFAGNRIQRPLPIGGAPSDAGR